MDIALSRIEAKINEAVSAADDSPEKTASRSGVSGEVGARRKDAGRDLLAALGRDPHASVASLAMTLYGNAGKQPRHRIRSALSYLQKHERIKKRKGGGWEVVAK